MQLAYREFGTGQPLIILHGLFGQSDNWNTLAKRFGASGFHVFTVDQRNHGLSPHSNIWDYTNMAADLLEFIQEHKLQNPILMGHSMGGKTVMFFELNYPGVASKISIVDIAPRAYDSRHDGVLKGLLSVDFTKTKNRKEAEETLNLFIEDFGTKQFLLKNIYWKDTANNIMDWRFNLNVIHKEYNNIGVSVPEKISKVPALFLRGEKSNYVTDNDLQDIAQRFPNYKLKTILNSGHWIHAEKPDEFFREVMEFTKA